jgi:hypothetical protein
MLRRSKESPVREPNGIDVNGYDQKYEPKARREIKGDKRISNLESQMKEVQEWKKQVQGGFRV